ncbi:hypothetical protein GCM10009676_33080 [Prauserella halophila]|uniref:Uncharacterized protein n=1 Tax=Prauserella halophila TaxID=185641 RepID=A0ABN1WFI4_9PSEU|nr:hypothetical protein [Prauserella halophila]
MDAIVSAVSVGRNGDSDTARRDLLRLWARIGVTGDPFHRCTLAHHLADLYDGPAEAPWTRRRCTSASTGRLSGPGSRNTGPEPEARVRSASSAGAW